jgi:hypothetical protein
MNGTVIRNPTAGMDLEPPARKTIDLEGRIVQDGVRKAVRERPTVLADLVYAVRQYRTAEKQRITLQGSEYAHAVHKLNKLIDRADALIEQMLCCNDCPMCGRPKQIQTSNTL